MSLRRFFHDANVKSWSILPEGMFFGDLVDLYTQICVLYFKFKCIEIIKTKFKQEK